VNLVKPRGSENTKEWWEERYRNSVADEKASPFLLDFYSLFPAEKPKMVDLACGAGRNAVALASKGAEVTGLDFSAAAVQKAQALAKKEGVQVEFKEKDLDFFLPELMAYDGMICVNYKPSPSLLKNLIRGLKKDGLLFMENYLMTASQKLDQVEPFECYRPGELWREFSTGALNYQVVFYSERGPSVWGQKVHLIIQKTEMM